MRQISERYQLQAVIFMRGDDATGHIADLAHMHTLPPRTFRTFLFPASEAGKITSGIDIGDVLARA